MAKKYQRTAAWVYSDPRWKVVAYQAKRRDGFKCTHAGCTARTRLEVDHVIALRDGGEPFELSNLQTLCKTHHGQKTRAETHGELSPEREAWRKLVLET